MEEEAPMDTDVSSTTDDVQEVHEVASTHRNVETVITVESVTEEDMSPKKIRQTDSKSYEHIDLTKPVPKPEMTIKKIIIKSPLKDLHVRPIQKSPGRAEESQKSVRKDGSQGKPAQPSTSQKPAMADSSSKLEKPSSQDEKTVQSTRVNSSVSLTSMLTAPTKEVQILPIKDSQQNDTTKEAMTKTLTKEKTPNVIIITKSKITKPQVKDSVTIVAKENQQKIILVRNSPKTNISKESLAKQTVGKDLAKEITTNQAQTPEKDSPSILSNQGPSNGSPSKQTAAKENPAKETVAKDSPAKQSPGKDTPAKLVAVKLTPAKQTPSSGSPSKQTPSKVSPAKDTPSKESPAEIPDQHSQHKDTTIKQSPSKEVASENLQAQQSLLIEVSAKQAPTKQFLDKQTAPTEVSEETPKEDPTKPVKEIPKIVLLTKEQFGKSTPKEPKPTSDKDIPTKIVQTKEQVAKTTPAKEPSREPPAKSKPVSSENESIAQESKEANLKNKNLSLLDDKEASNDSQMETASDSSEKEHNKSISRELKSLIKSAKESKIISECTQLTSKTRKSRTPLDSSLNASGDAEKIQAVRRSSHNSQVSNSSEQSDKATAKRAMRSQNPEFVSKVKNFLNSVAGKGPKTENEADEDGEDKAKENAKEITPSLPKKKKTEELVAEKPAPEKITTNPNNQYRMDPYCWRCHWAVDPPVNEKPQIKVQCNVCPRTYHFKCLTGTERSKVHADKSWVCPECTCILQAESSETRSPAMKKISLGMLKDLLKHALDRMMDIHGAEPFMSPVDRSEFPTYDNYVVHPMDLSLMRKQIDEGLYGSTEAFLADVQWILHNCIIFNTCGNLQAKLTGGARALVRSCRAEMGEIEACPECYAAAHARRATWFTDVCTTPHILLWAKLKGFPYWPAKGMSTNNQGLVDVRFFGAHDRAWVPARDCFLFSEKDPNNFRTKRQDILDSMQEAEQHIRNISRKYGKFVYPPFKTVFEPNKLNEQLKLMIPSFEGEVRSPAKDKTNSSPATMKNKRRSVSKSSKGSLQEGDASEGEESAVKSRKMATGAEIAREEDFAVDKEKEKPMEVDPSVKKETVTLRKRRKSMFCATPAEADSSPKTVGEPPKKRRRSQLEEAVITIIDNNSTREKRKRVENAEKKDSKDSVDKKETANKKETAQKETPNVKELDKSKVETPSTSTVDKKNSPRVTPIRVISIAKVMKNGNVSPKVNLLKKDDETTPKQKAKPDKVIDKDNTENKVNTEQDQQKNNKEEKKAKRRNSTKNKALNNSNVGKSVKTDNISKEATAENTSKVNPIDNTSEEKVVPTTSKEKSTPNTSKEKSTPNTSKEKSTPNTSKEKSTPNTSKEKSTPNTSKEKAVPSTSKERATPTTNKEKSAPNIKEKGKANKTNNSDTNKPSSSSEAIKAKDRIQFDDDTSLAVLAKVAKSNTSISLPTISSVRSLSDKGATSKSIEVTVEATQDSRIFTPTSTDHVKNMREAVNKLQKLRGDKEPQSTPPQVGRVGVRAFARMTSPEKNTRQDVQVEVKTEPMDYEESDRQLQDKIDLMSSFSLRPVNPPTNLRDVRINKVVVTPLNRKGATPPQVTSTRARKTFPQPKKPDEGRSELTSKNSMVYIPIQPPVTQAPPRGGRPAALVSTPPQNRATVTTISSHQIISSIANQVNTITSPLQFSSPSSSATPTNSSNPIQTMATIGHMGQLPTMPTVGQVSGVPTTVHTMPLITSVNGQWTFSLQPVLSVGGVDGDPSPPMMNGIGERPTLVPITPNPQAMLIPATPPANNNTTQNTDSTTQPAELPRLQQRPSLVNPLDANAPVGCVPPPSTVGPLTAKLNQNSVKMTDFFRTLLEDSIEKLDEPLAQVTSLKLKLEQVQWRHQQELDEVKHNHELILAEMRSSFEKEKLRLVTETRRQSQVELDTAVKLAKSKQWCANCNQEAQFYCCWNTAYCDYPCQRAHWATHYAVCAQHRTQDNINEENRLQQAPENLPKTIAAPNLAAAKQLQPSRMYTQEQAPQKTSIIMSMVEDNSGNQTMKCVGTYKSPSGPNQISPLIINKQIMSSEETAKKVVTSGGYLIVGASNATNSTTITPARRATAIQYIS